MSKQLTFEQEAAQVLERMARLKRESGEATEKEREILISLDERIKAIWDVINQVNAERDAELAELEERAKGLGLRAEQTIKTPHGTIKFKNGYLRVTYNAKDLDAASKTPENAWVSQFRSESSVAPSVKVELAG